MSQVNNPDLTDESSNSSWSSDDSTSSDPCITCGCRYCRVHHDDDGDWVDYHKDSDNEFDHKEHDEYFHAEERDRVREMFFYAPILSVIQEYFILLLNCRRSRGGKAMRAAFKAIDKFKKKVDSRIVFSDFIRALDIEYEHFDVPYLAILYTKLDRAKRSYRCNEVFYESVINLCQMMKDNQQKDIKPDIKLDLKRKIIEDECVICFEMKPVTQKTSCNHFFCESCMNELKRLRYNCAYCRQKFKIIKL